MKKFNIITYIKPTNDIDMFIKTLSCVMKIKHLDKFCISFKEKLTEDYIVELNKYDNVIWSDGIDEFWATEMQRLLNTYPADYYYIWEEDSYIFDNKSLFLPEYLYSKLCY